MTSETDAEFVERIASFDAYPGFDGWRTVSVKNADLARLFALARRGAAVDDVVEAAMWAIDHVARYNSPERITEARALVRRVALPLPEQENSDEQ